jgi:glycosyltransferase involved in cell wall biosynthesis
MEQIRIIGFMNAYGGEGLSGGDVCFIETFKRLGSYNKIIITPLSGKMLCEKWGIIAEYLITSKEKKHFNNVIFSYLNRTIKALLTRVKVSEGDLLYSSSDFLPDVIPAFIIRIRQKKTKWIQKIFHLIPRKRIIPFLAQRLSFFLIKNLADLIIVDSNLLRNSLLKQGFKRDAVKVNYPGITGKIFNATATVQKKDYDGIFLGRFHVSKGIFDLIEIWKLVSQEFPDAKLAISGRGEKSAIKELKNQINDLSLSNNIDILGCIEEEKKGDFLKRAKVFVFPSHEEGFGIVIAEAISCGLPVVGWNLPVFDEVFGKGMVKVAMGDKEGFAGEIMRLLKDPGYSGKLVREGREFIGRYDWERVVQEEEKLLCGLSEK